MGYSFRELVAWQKAKQLALSVYRETEHFPQTKMYGLTAQIRRAAISVPSNIAEGQGRGSKPDFAKFLCVARGSLLELLTQLEIARDLGYTSAESFNELQKHNGEVLRILNGLLDSLQSESRPSRTRRTTS